MYLVADAGGPIGRAVTEQLVGQGQLVRVLTADDACRDLWRGRGVEVNEGDPKHAASWTKALSGVQTLIAILPPFLSEEGLLGAADGYRSALVEALSSSGSDFRADHAREIKIVLLSAMGAEKKIGWAKTLGQLESELKSCCENLTIIRTAFIMENLASGMAMAKYAPNQSNALALMNFLVSEPAQKMYAETNMEYPVRPGVEPSKLVKSWGQFKADNLSLETIAQQRKAALILLDKAQFDL